jgi:hypothetical protein
MFLSKRLSYLRRLNSLGFFKHKKKKFDAIEHRNLLYFKNIYFFFRVKAMAISLFTILPLLESVNLIKSCFLFIDLKKTNLFFLNNFYKLISYLTAFVIYD